MKMKPEDLKALELSIIKWDLICQGLGGDKGSSNCPLCKRFLNNWRPRPVWYTTKCVGCPVWKKTGKSFCNGSPYADWVAIVERSEWWAQPLNLDALVSNLRSSKRYPPSFSNKVIAAAEAELIFLLTLLPKDHKWRDQI